jgi:hypothetical protein
MGRGEGRVVGDTECRKAEAGLSALVRLGKNFKNTSMDTLLLASALPPLQDFFPSRFFIPVYFKGFVLPAG